MSIVVCKLVKGGVSLEEFTIVFPDRMDYVINALCVVEFNCKIFRHEINPRSSLQYFDI